MIGAGTGGSGGPAKFPIIFIRIEIIEVIFNFEAGLVLAS